MNYSPQAEAKDPVTHIKIIKEQKNTETYDHDVGSWIVLEVL